METKIIRVLSRQNFNNYIKEHRFIKNGVPDDVAIIEIFNSDVQEDVTNRFGIEDEFNYKNNLASAKVFGSNVLHLVFDDILGEHSINIDGKVKNLTPFRFFQATSIIWFLIRNINCEKFIIHCSAGISRSGAVGKFIFDFLSEQFNVRFPEMNNIHPNGHVLDLLNKTAKCIGNSNPSNDVMIFPSITKIQLIPWQITNDDVKSNQIKYQHFFKKELNEICENSQQLVNDIVNDRIQLKFIQEYIYEHILNNTNNE